MTQETKSFKLPRLRLMQALSPAVAEETAKAGEWRLDNVEELTLPIVVIPIQQVGRRENRDDDSFDLLCFSEDMLTGIGEPGGDCNSCPLNRWAGQRGNRTPPVCTEIQAFVVYIPKNGEIAQIDLSRTSLPIAGTIETQALMRGGLQNLALEIGSFLKPDGRYRYMVPTVKRITMEDGWKEEMEEAIGLIHTALAAATQDVLPGFQAAMLQSGLERPADLGDGEEHDPNNYDVDATSI